MHSVHHLKVSDLFRWIVGLLPAVTALDALHILMQAGEAAGNFPALNPHIAVSIPELADLLRLPGIAPHFSSKH